MCKINLEENRRDCPVCGSANKSLIAKQNFESIQKVTFIKSYDVAVCDNCGMAYADNIEKPENLNVYYSQQSKYEPIKAMPLNECSNVKFYEKSVLFLQKYLQPDSSVLDCGCGQGTFLRVLKSHGYKNLKGIDPAQNCVDSLQISYEIKAEKSDIESYVSDKKYDSIVLSAVLEHVVDLDFVIKKIKILLKENGTLFLSVPDVSNFLECYDAPFQQFSSEHVNYFTVHSLKNLFSNYGFFVEEYNQCIEWINNGASSEPILRVVLRNGKRKENLDCIKDIEAKQVLNQYADKSKQFLAHIDEKFMSLVSTQEPIIIWGVGTFIMKALTLTHLKDCNIIAFVDSNAKYADGKWNNIKVLPPEALKDYDYKILIGSIGFKEEIKQQIINKMKLKNEIIVLDD
ncbi:class I SAM-dependent methyltransferase [Anaerosinus massiliensis]|uniref:class I SAM-dependent methyltransferase n=1 Tax=Massilibacillus massiliensis TaxID=1806837 RepID=UPI000DA62FA9|nr:class I SAM-dependent methyltransferase [Massilibacillus massiliensis]